jgi:Fe-S oxidoreductase
MDEKEKIKSCCLEKEVAPCVSACPFHIDARTFISRMRRGGFNFAYRLYADSVGFPDIVSRLCGAPCEAGCPLKQTDGPIAMKLLEQASVSYASNREPNSYNLPPRGKSAAIIGAGPSGLACLLKLANRKYDVTLFEKSGRIGGSLWNKLPSEVFLTDVELQLKNEEYKLCLNTEITDIKEIADKFDAVYIATGAAVGDFGLSFDRGAGKPVSAGGNIYAGGSLTGSESPVQSIADGIRAAALLEDHIKTGNVQTAQTQQPTRIRINADNIVRAPAVQPSDHGCFTKNEAKEEAKRCIMCRCDFCVKACDLMQYYQKFPKLIEQEVHITIYPGTLDGNGTVSTRLISTCNQCGLCAAACPEDIDVGLFLRQSHIAMRNKGAMPWAFHEFWLRDMEHADSEKASFSWTPSGAGKSRYLFFPGCQSGASNPDYVLKPYGFLLEKLPDTSVYLRCCGAPALWGGEEALYEKSRGEIRAKWEELGRPTFIFSCATCMEIFRQYLPEIKGVSLLEMLTELSVAVPRDEAGREVAVFDPCASRNFPAAQSAARELVRQAGYETKPLAYDSKMARCCSWGGQVDVANPPYAKWVVDRRKTDSELPYVVYCTNCRDIFAEAGKPVRHILDILFNLGGWADKPPTYSQRHRSREYLKGMLERRYGGHEGAEPMQERLVMEPDVEAKINKDKILEEDVLSVIHFCETSGRKLRDQQSGHFIGYHEVGHMTFWAEYAPEGDGWRLFNAYGHRMKIELEEVWNGRKQKADL